MPFLTVPTPNLAAAREAMVKMRIQEHFDRAWPPENWWDWTRTMGYRAGYHQAVSDLLGNTVAGALIMDVDWIVELRPRRVFPDGRVGYVDMTEHVRPVAPGRVLVTG